MAFTQTPAEATDKVKRIPVIGGQTLASNIDEASAYQGQRYINCYPKRVTLTNTDDKWVLTKTPAWVEETRVFSGSGTDPIGCVSSDGAYIWKGRRLYQTAITPSLVYTGTNNLTVHSMYKVINASSTTDLYAGVLYDNTTGLVHSYTWDGTTFTLSASIANTSLGSGNHTPNVSAYLNGRLYILGTASRIYNTSPGAYTTWNSTWYIVPEMSGDAVIGILTYKNHLVAFSEQSVEFFYDNAIDIGSPLERQPAYAQAYGIKNSWNLTNSGDKVFFLSWEDRAGYGVYTLDNFNVTKISNLYIDTFFSNADVTGNFPALVNFRIADLFGDLCLVMDRFSAPLWAGILVYSTNQKIWFEMTLPDTGNTTSRFSFFQWANNATLPEWLTYWISGVAYSGDNVTFHYLTKDYTPSTSVTAEYIEDITDLGTQNWKHYKTIYFVGDPGDNSVELSWTPSMDYSNWSLFYSRTATGNMDEFLRWDNLGRYRRLARRWRFSGTSNIHMEGSEIKYSLGSH